MKEKYLWTICGIIVLVIIGVLFLKSVSKEIAEKGKILETFEKSAASIIPSTDFVKYSEKVDIDPRLKGKIEVQVSEAEGPKLLVVFKSLSEEGYKVKLYIDWKDTEGKIIEKEKWGLYDALPTITDDSGDKRYFPEGAYDYQIRVKLIDPASYIIKGNYKETSEVKGKIVLLKRENSYNDQEKQWNVKYSLKNITQNEAFSLSSCWEFWDVDGESYEHCSELPTIHPEDELTEIQPLDHEVIKYELSFEIKESSPSHPKTDRKIIEKGRRIRTIAELIYSDKEGYSQLCSQDNRLNFTSQYGEELKQIRDEIYRFGGKDIKCYAKGEEYCVEVKLNSGKYYCASPKASSEEEENVFPTSVCSSRYKCR